MGARDKVVHILESYVSKVYIDVDDGGEVSPQVRRDDCHGLPCCQQRDLRLWNIYTESDDPADFFDIEVMVK